MEGKLIVCREVSFAYDGEAPILNEFNLELAPGFTLLLGPNGSGKSTLLRLMAGVEMPDSGQIFINRTDLWAEEVRARSQLVYFPEYPDLTPYATIQEVMNLVCRLRRLPLKTGDNALHQAGVLHLKKRSVRELSNGQRRRAIFACCLAGETPVVLMDEPLEGMDRQMQKKILSWLKERKAAGATILVVSHSFDSLLPLADQALTIKAGQAAVHQNLPRDPGRKQLFLEKLAEASGDKD